MLKPKQVKCLEIMLYRKKTDKEIAETINVSPKTICEWKKSCPEFQAEYNKLMRNNMQYAAPKAFRKQMRLLESKNDMVAHMAAKDIMDRAGFNPTEKIDMEADMDINICIDYGDEG